MTTTTKNVGFSKSILGTTQTGKSTDLLKNGCIYAETVAKKQIQQTLLKENTRRVGLKFKMLS